MSASQTAIAPRMAVPTKRQIFAWSFGFSKRKPAPATTRSMTKAASRTVTRRRAVSSMTNSDTTPENVSERPHRRRRRHPARAQRREDPAGEAHDRGVEGPLAARVEVHARIFGQRIDHGADAVAVGRAREDVRVIDALERRADVVGARPHL